MHLSLPHPSGKILLHSCCAPCAGGILLRLIESEIDTTVFFYNPNIQPPEEYQKRKGEIIRFCQKLNVPFIDGDYEPSIWQSQVRGLEQEPERGRRCEVCFDLRLDRTARFAKEGGIPIFATTLGASRWKDLAQINAAGARAAGRYPGRTFWPKNWRAEGGDTLSAKISHEENFFRQKYCGCLYSLNSKANPVTSGPLQGR